MTASVDSPTEPPRLSLWQRVAAIGGDIPAGWARPLPGLRALRIDVPVALLLVALIVMNERFGAALAGTPFGTVHPTPTWAQFVTPALFLIALSLRRVFPLPAMLLGLTAFMVGQFAPYMEFVVTQVACFVCIYSGAAWSRYRVAVTSINLVALGVFVWMGMVGSSALAAQAGGAAFAVVTSVVFALLINLLYVAAATLFGANDYRRAANEAVLAQRTEELSEYARALEAERRVVAEQAVRLDRVEIARELHDVVAHHVSLMGLQAAAARRSLAVAPEKAEGALLGVEESARSAITELQLLLTTLRTSDTRVGDAAAGAGSDAGAAAGAGAGAGAQHADTDAPSTRSLEQIPALVNSVREAGMHVGLHIVGEPRGVAATVGLTAYRILQEALTNARKYAGDGTEVDVRLRYLPRSIELDVSNDAPPMPRARSSAGGGGRGITGMRERAAAVGGQLEAGARPGGGFRVRAVLPARG